MGKKQTKVNLLPFSLVEQAASGDIEAIDQVLRHYAGYIRTLATRKFYDEYGMPHICLQGPNGAFGSPAWERDMGKKKSPPVFAVRGTKAHR